MAKKFLDHIRVNETTGAKSYYYPMPVEDTPENQAFISSMRALGYEVGWTRLGFEVIHAVLVPCQKHFTDHCGRTVYLDTPEDEQRLIYNELVREALAEQDKKRHDGRCSFFDEHGLRVRCPYRVPNPDYDANRSHGKKKNPKSIINRCECCQYFPFKEAHDVMTFSALESDDENGEAIPYEPATSWESYETERFPLLKDETKSIIHQYKPKLDRVVDLLAEGLTQAEVAKVLGKSPTTINSQVQVLKHLLDTLPALQKLLLNS